MDARRLTLATCLALLVNGCATAGTTAPGPSLDDVIAFSDPAMCAFTEDTAKLIGDMVRGDPHAMDTDRWIEPGAVPANLQDRLGPILRIKHDEWWVIRTPARGTLWGLPLTAIEQDFPVGGDAGGITFEFAASPRTVERAARARGLLARAGKAVPMGVPDGMAYEITLQRAPGNVRRSHLSCGYH
jgi:hypothetical protein